MKSLTQKTNSWLNLHLSRRFGRYSFQFIYFLVVEDMDGAKKVNEWLIVGVTIVAGAIDWAGSTLNEVDVLIDIAKSNMERIEELSDFFNFAESNITSGFYNKLNTVKIDLLKLRRELLVLAEKTTTHCDKMKIVLSLPWEDDYANRLMEKQIIQLDKLVNETLVSLKNAKVRYETLIETWQRIDNDKSFEAFKVTLKKMNETESKEQKDFETGVNTAFATGVPVTLAITISLDVVGCLGICTAAVALFVIAPTAIGANQNIHHYRGRLNSLITQIEDSTDSFNKIIDTCQDGVETLQEELILVDSWEVKAISVKQTLNGTTFKEISEIAPVKAELLHAVVELGDAARKYKVTVKDRPFGIVQMTTTTESQLNAKLHHETNEP